MSSGPLVSIVIPTLNAEYFISSCLDSIAQQSYGNIEVIVVDGFSNDSTVERARGRARVLIAGPDQSKGRVFGAPYQRNYGASHAKGDYIYYVDADMELMPDVVWACVDACERGRADAVIVREDSFGIGYWAACKTLERRCYWGDNNIEAPRFIRASVWRKLGGLNHHIAADDWDLHARLRHEGYGIVRVLPLVRHNEGALALGKLVRKRYLYGRQVMSYLRSTRRPAFDQGSLLFRSSYVRNWRLFARDPLHAPGVAVMRLAEMTAAVAGLMSSIARPVRLSLSHGKP